MSAAALFPSLILTRPQAQNPAWAQALAALGVGSVALPLLEIGLRDDAAFAAAHAQALQALHGQGRWRAIMHVSPNAVAGFWHARALAAWQAGRQSGAALPRLWAPGPGTAQALLALGFTAQEIDQPRADAAQFDSESLWDVVGPQCAAAMPGQGGLRGQVLIVRGMAGRPPASGGGVASSAESPGQGRDWLAQRLREQGVGVAFLAAYWRACPVWSAVQCEQARQAAARRQVWLLSSSEGVRYLPRLLPSEDWRAHRAIATHERIAATAQALGFAQVAQARPTPQAVAQALASLGS